MLVRSLTLALSAALLTSAAPPQTSVMRAAAECRLPRSQMFSALNIFPVERTVDNSKDGERYVTSIYKVPADLLAYGFPAKALGASDIRSATDERMLLMVTVEAPYEDVERAVLAAKDMSECETPTGSEGDKGCGVYARQVDGWRVAVVIKQYDEDVGIACSMSRRPK